MNDNKHVCIIGNYGGNQSVFDGGRIKIRLYFDILKREKINVRLIDLNSWSKHIIKIFRKIKKTIKNNEIILVMAGPRGSRKIIPIVNFLNRKKRCRVVYCPLGIGTLEHVIKKMNIKEYSQFLLSCSSAKKSDKFIGKQLKKVNLIIPQNQIIADCYKNFYSIDNVTVLNNFRDTEIKNKNYSTQEKTLSLIFASRVCKEKGIFDLVNVVNSINSGGDVKVQLTICGEIQLNKNEKLLFDSLLNENVQYIGVVDQKLTIDLFKKFDLFVLPTKYCGEGTPGALIESFLSGTPALISSYSQSKILIKDGVDGFIFDINDTESLKKKILYILSKKEILEKIGLAAQEKANVYTYSFNKTCFFTCLLGNEK